MKFKIGDKVRIKKGKSVRNGCQWVSNMNKFIGEEFIIEKENMMESHKDMISYNGWSFLFEWLESINKINKKNMEVKKLILTEDTSEAVKVVRKEVCCDVCGVDPMGFQVETHDGEDVLICDDCVKQLYVFIPKKVTKKKK